MAPWQIAENMTNSRKDKHSGAISRYVLAIIVAKIRCIQPRPIFPGLKYMMLTIYEDFVTVSPPNEVVKSCNRLFGSLVLHENWHLECDAIEGPANRRSVSQSAVRNIGTKRPSNLEHFGHDDPKSLRSLLPIFKMSNICPIFAAFLVRGLTASLRVSLRYKTLAGSKTVTCSPRRWWSKVGGKSCMVWHLVSVMQSAPASTNPNSIV